MNSRVSTALRKLSVRRYGSDPDPRRARKEYRAMKRDWNATPSNQRAKTMTILHGITDIIEEAQRKERDVAAANEVLARVVGPPVTHSS